MKKFVDICLEVGTDMKEKFEKGEQIRYKDYLTEENVSILENLKTDYEQNQKNFANQVSELDEIGDPNMLYCIAKFLVDLLDIDLEKYIYLLDVAQFSEKIIQKSKQITLGFEESFSKSRDKKQLDYFIQYITENPVSLLRVASKDSSYYKFSILEKLDTENKLIVIQNKISSSYNQETFQL